MAAGKKIASIAALAVCAVALVWWIFPANAQSPNTEAASRSPPIQEPPLPSVAVVPVEPKRPAVTASAAATKPTQKSAFDTTNLFSTFQLAQSSTSLDAVEKGLAAWRTCAGYVGFGAWDLETWLRIVLPEGLSIEERDKRAKYGLASSLRCSGFAGQIQAASEAEELENRARAMGSSAENLRHAVRNLASDEPRYKPLIAKLSCEVVQQYPASIQGIRLMSIALRNAAEANPSHVLNATAQPARSIAINLAFCDLDPAGCGIHSNFVGSACMQSGQCSYEREEEYWVATTKPDHFAEAQKLRQALVKLVGDRDCAALFG